MAFDHDIPHRQGHDTDWFKDMYDSFEPVRRSISESGLNGCDVNQAIDEAVAASRDHADRGQ
ncbi:MAG: hypothetical protein ACR2JC_11965 [Chloroflexota bacterium]